MKVQCSAAISGDCPHRDDCPDGREPHEFDERFCTSRLCNRFKILRMTDNRWIRQRVTCREVEDVHSADVSS